MFISKEFDRKLSEAFDLYYQQKFENYPPQSELDKITFSEELEKKMQRLIKAQRKPYFYMINTVGKRVAIIIVTFLIALTVTTFSVKGIREAVIEFITETFEKFTEINVKTPQPSEIDFEKIKPQYITDGYVLEKESYSLGNAYSIIYRNNTNESITYIQQTTNSKEIDIDTEKIKFQTVYINGFEGIMYFNKEYNNIIFATDDCYFIIIGKISNEELIKIAESIKIK